MYTKAQLLLYTISTYYHALSIAKLCKNVNKTSKAAEKCKQTADNDDINVHK